MLYIVPTPIGNLKDITQRAIDVLGSVDLILAEDTRTTRVLLDKYDIKTPTSSYHIHNEHKITDKYIASLQGGQDIALVSDAGTPAISDPGFLLIRACHENDIKVISLPGANAAISAIVGSGIPSDRFHFEGFLPNKKGRRKRWDFLKTYPYSIVLYESPYRIVKLLEEICEYLGNDRKVAIVKEISKVYEDISLDICENHLKKYKEINKIKGEYVVVIDGKSK